MFFLFLLGAGLLFFFFSRRRGDMTPSLGAMQDPLREIFVPGGEPGFPA